ncbi:MAG TPA: family 78 glycoside hydrolase catalytic domain [Caulobacteraceae bacterium]|nr:family 78 glycoside hydrolase catalytic domain [Caulobacteraceae bacterium]
MSPRDAAPGQSAFRVRVGSSEAGVAGGGADLWDSGRVGSDQSFDVAYAGKPLGSRQRCWWTVEVWDEAGEQLAAPPPNWWEMGLLEPGDWTAAWLAVEGEEEREDRLAGLNWIWGDPPDAEPARRFRFCFELADAAEDAVLYIAGRDRLLSAHIDGGAIALPAWERNAFGRAGAAELRLGRLGAGTHTLASEVRLSRNATRLPPGRGAFAALLKLRHADGRVSRLASGPGWRTALDAAEDWTRPGFDDAAWAAARPAAIDPGQPLPPTPARLFRRDFALGKPVERARLYITALGAYEAFINGQRVGDGRLAPESTNFRKRALYRAHDVTTLLRHGANAIGAHVGDGWYASVVAPGGRYAFGPPPRRLRAQLEVVFADGSTAVVRTDGDWRIGSSPVLTSEIYDGEIWDARAEQPGWSAPGFDASGWPQARSATAPPCALVAETAPPIRPTMTLEPRTISEPRPGVFVFDFGQNFAGVCRLHVKGKAGDRVELRFAEILKADGEVDQANLRAAKARDIYILKGDPAGETFEPSFTYHGFRYVEVEGFPGTPTLEALEGVVLHSDLPIAGDLGIEQPLIGRLWRNSLWSQRSNFTGIPTDCPQRDERLGWLGDACVFWDAAAFNMDVYAFTARFTDDMRDAQTEAGAFSDYAPPAMRAGDEPAPGWADAGVVLPWTAWMRSGNTSVIDRNWDAIVRYLGYLEAANPDHLWRNKRGLDFGDWLALDAKQPGDPTTPKDLIGSAWWAHSAGLAAEMAAVIGRTDEAERFAALREQIAQAFQSTYVRADGGVGNDSQTGYILALQFGLVPEALREAAVERLVADIDRRDGALSTGFLGTPFALDVLADAGRAALVYDLLLRTEFPSWGYMAAKGATTIWERWNGDVGDVAMNSFNHYALGAVTGFLFRRIAGIAPAAPGFKQVAIRPVLDPRVKRGGGAFRSVLGPISTEWEQGEHGVVRLTALIPPNAQARVHLPARPGQRVQDDAGEPVAELARTPDEVIVEIGSGRSGLQVG